MESLLDKAVENGFLLLFSCAVLFGVGWGLVRLLGKQGILVDLGKRLLETLIEFLTDLKDTVNRIADSTELGSQNIESLGNGLEKNTNKIDELIGLHKDNDSPFATERLRKAAWNATKIARRVCVELKIYDEVKEHFDEIEHELKKPRENPTQNGEKTNDV